MQRRAIRFLAAFASLLIVASLVATGAAQANHNNRGTVKVHDNEDENPDVRNVPHVTCDFWVEGFFMGDDSGWLEFFAWPPTGNMEPVTPSGDDLNWTADSGDESGEFHFLKGPYFLDPGHYRVEVYTDDGHPGGGGHFAKSKTFWVDPCPEDGNGPTPQNPPCPPDVTAQAVATPVSIELDWGSVENATAYNVYRAVEEGDFELIATVNETEFTDTNVTVGVTYSYYVTALVGGLESVNCEIVTVTAIPFFPGLVLGALALVGSVGAYAWIQRKK